MQTAEKLRLVLFVGFIVITYFLALIAVVRSVQRKHGGRFRRVVDRASVILALIGSVCIAYGYLIEPNTISVTKVEIESPKIPLSADGIRIVHLSDVHSDEHVRFETKVKSIVEAQRPDVIVLTGDYFNSLAAAPVFQTFLTSLMKIAPTYVVKGNWETHHHTEIEVFGSTGVHELNGSAVRLEIRGAPIWISGLAAGNEADFIPMLKDVPPGEFLVLLYHYPDFIHNAAERGVDLYLAGHTHGGQVALPFYGALVTLSRFGKRFEAGLFYERNTWMYVNRGIGLDGGFWPRVRFLVPPEVTVLDLVPGSELR